MRVKQKIISYRPIVIAYRVITLYVWHCDLKPFAYIFITFLATFYIYIWLCFPQCATGSSWRKKTNYFLEGGQNGELAIIAHPTFILVTWIFHYFSPGGRRRTDRIKHNLSASHSAASFYMKMFKLSSLAYHISSLLFRSTQTVRTTPRILSVLLSPECWMPEREWVMDYSLRMRYLRCGEVRCGAGRRNAPHPVWTWTNLYATIPPLTVQCPLHFFLLQSIHECFAKEKKCNGHWTV